MPTFQGRTIVTMPPLPGPRDVQWGQSSNVATNTSPFTGEEQVLDWNSSFLTATLSLPPLGDPTLALAWVNFLLGCKGKKSCFAIPAGWSGFTPPVASSGYWSLASNEVKYSVSGAQLYGMSFDIREVLA